MDEPATDSREIHGEFRGRHDCAPRSLLRAVPELDPGQVLNAFTLCSEKWPYGGVSNKEFEITVKFLGLEHEYCGDEETLEDVLDRKPGRCVALLWGHFIAIRDGEVAGYELLAEKPAETTVVCSWVFG